MAVRDDLRRRDGPSVSENIVQQRPAADKAPPRVADPVAAPLYEAASNMGAGLLNISFQDADRIAGADVAQPNRDMVKERIATEEQIQREIADGTGSITNLTVRDTAQWTSLAQTATQKEKDKKGGIDITTQLILLNQQIEALQRQIDFYEGENDRLRDEIDEIDQLAADIRAGRVDPDDPRLAKYGIDPDDLANGGDAALGKLDDGRKTRQQQIADNQAKIDDAKQNQQDAQAEIDAAHERGASAESTASVRNKGMDAYLAQHEIAGELKALTGEAPDNEASENMATAKTAEIQDFATVDETIERFMKEAARIEQIDDSQERLIAEKEFVDAVRSLPENMMDAAIEIEFAENTMHMFEDGYFAALETQTADSGSAPPHHGDQDLNKDNGQGNMPGNSLG